VYPVAYLIYTTCAVAVNSRLEFYWRTANSRGIILSTYWEKVGLGGGPDRASGRVAPNLNFHSLPGSDWSGRTANQEEEEAMIEFECPNCQKFLRVKDELRGRTGKCPRCRRAVEVPMESQVSSAQLPELGEEPSAAPPPGAPLPTAAVKDSAPKALPARAIARGGGGFMQRVFYFDLFAAAGSALLLLGPISVIGFKSDGLYPFLVGIACVGLIGYTLHTGRVTRVNQILLALLGIAATAIGVIALVWILRAGASEPHPFARVLASAANPGLGMYLSILGGLALMAGGLGPMLASKYPWAQFLMKRLKE